MLAFPKCIRTLCRLKLNIDNRGEVLQGLICLDWESYFRKRFTQIIYYPFDSIDPQMKNLYKAPIQCKYTYEIG